MSKRERILENKEAEQAKKCIMPLLRQATKQEYMNWLKSTFYSGVKQEYRYRNNTWENIKDNWYVATNHLLSPVKLYGADSMNIIIPAHLYVEYDPHSHMQWGHITLCFEKTGTNSYNIIEIYSDIFNFNCEVGKSSSKKKKFWR